MLQSMREKITGWFAWVILSLVALTFIFWGIQYYLDRARSESKWAAKVGKQVITQQDWDRIYQLMLREYKQRTPAANLSPNMLASIKEYALKEAVNQSLLTQGAQQLHLGVSQAVLLQLVQTDPHLQENGHFSSQKLNQLLLLAGLTPAQFLQEIKASILVQQQQGGLAETDFALPGEVMHLWSALQQKISFSQMRLPLSQVSPKPPSLEELKQVYQSRMSEFELPEAVDVAYIEGDFALTGSGEKKITESDLKHFYEEHRAQFIEPERWQLAKLVFSSKEVADKNYQKAVLESKLSKAETGWINALQASQALQSLLRQQGLRISHPIATPEGYALIQVLQHVPEKEKPFSAVRELIQKQLQEQHKELIMNEKEQALSEAIESNPLSLQPAAALLGLPIQVAHHITRSEKAGLFSNPKVLSAVFSHAVLQGSNNSAVLTLPNQHIVVLRVVAHEPKKPIPFDQVKAKIAAEMLHQRQVDALGVKAYAIEKRLQKGESLQKIARLAQLPVHYFQAVSRRDQHFSPALLAALFATAKGGVQMVSDAQGNLLINQVDQIIIPSVQALPVAEKQVFSQTLSHFYGELVYQLYQRHLVDTVPVQIAGHL